MASNPVALITGASSGIGAATARLLGARQYHLVLAARREAELEALAGEVRSLGGNPLVVPTDLTRYDQIENLVGRAVSHFGQVDLLLNNAGLGHLNWLEHLDPLSEVAVQVQVNLIGLIQTTRLVLPHMIARQRGHIINIGSIAGLVATPTYSVYAATKFGVRGFTDALRREVGVHGVYVTGIYPGGVATEFGQKAGIRRKTGLSTPKSLKLTADDVAQAVWRAAQKPRRATVILPGVMWPAIWLNRLAPGVVDRIIERRFTRRERGS